MPDNAKNEILELLKAQAEATARGDAEAVVAAGAPEIVRYDLPPPLEYRGDKDGAIAGLREWFATWDGPVTTEFANPTFLINGDLAVAYGFSRMRGNKKGDVPIDSWNRRTVVLRKLSGQWRIVHEHSSYPMAMDGSRRTETGLNPPAGAT